MDPAVALVQAYLELNGYLTIVEFPIAQRTVHHGSAVTDVDLIALRFPHARPLGAPSGGTATCDPLLAPKAGVLDLLICEVKEGKARLNPNLARRETLAATLRRAGCCPEDHINHHVQALLRHGEADMNHNGVRCRARIAVFAGRSGGAGGARLVVPLRHVATQVCRFLETHRDLLNVVRLTQPSLALLQLLHKLGALPASVVREGTQNRRPQRRRETAIVSARDAAGSARHQARGSPSAGEFPPTPVDMPHGANLGAAQVAGPTDSPGDV